MISPQTVLSQMPHTHKEESILHNVKKLCIQTLGGKQQNLKHCCQPLWKSTQAHDWTTKAPPTKSHQTRHSSFDLYTTAQHHAKKKTKNRCRQSHSPTSVLCNTMTESEWGLMVTSFRLSNSSLLLSLDLKFSSTRRTCRSEHTSIRLPAHTETCIKNTTTALRSPGYYRVK